VGLTVQEKAGVAAVTVAPAEAEPRLRKGKKQKQDGKKTYGRTAKVGAVWSMMRQGVNETIGLPVSMVMARLLSPHDFGVAAASGFFIQLAARLTQFGFGASLVRVKEMRPEHLSSIYLAIQGMGIFTFTVLYVAAPMFGQFFRSDEAGALLRLAALSFVINPLGVVPAALFQRRMQFKYTVLADWVDTIVGAVVTIVFGLRGFAYWSIVYGHLSGLIVRVILQLFLSRWRPTLTFSKTAFRELLGFGLGIQTKRLLDYAATNLDNLVVGRLLGMSALGIYNKAFTNMNKLVFRMTLGQAPFRIFSIIHEDRERFARAYQKLILSITLMGYPVLAGCIVAAEPMFLLLYGKQWLPAVFPFQLLCAGGMMQLLSAYSSQANEAAGNIWRQTARQAFGVVLVVVGTAIGSRLGGVTGAAIGVLVAFAFTTLALQALVREATGLSRRGMIAPQLPAMICAGLVASVVFAAGMGVRAVVHDPAPWQLFLAQVLAGGAAYATYVLFVPITAVREVVNETIDELLPAGPARALRRLRGLTGQQA
jgi:O-antigen/teichoic acid export membrane protein